MKAAVVIIVIFFLLFFSATAYTQNPWIDSLKESLQTEAADTNKINTLLALNDAYRFSKPDSALLYGQQALSIAEKLKSDDKIFWSIAAVNSALYVLGNYALELDYAYRALPYAKKINTPYTIGYSNGMLSDCYFNLGEYDTSIKYWKVVVKLCEQTLPSELCAIYGNTCHIFSSMKQYDSALLYAGKSVAELNRNPALNKYSSQGKFLRSNLFIGFGDAFAGKAMYDSALFYYKASLLFTNEINMDVNRVDAFSGLARVYKETDHNDSAIVYAKKALSENLTKTYPQGFLKAANLLAAVYESEKNADSSLKYLHLAINVKDSLFNREKTTAFQNILFKEQEKQRDIEVAKQKLQRQYLTYFLIALLMIAIIIAGVVIRNRRIKLLQNMRNSIADDLHDDIGSALSSISIMSELAKNQLPRAKSLLTSIGESTTTIQENMSDIVWTIKAGNDRFENILQRMNQFAFEILDAKNMNLDFKSDASLAAMRLSMEQRKNFYLFFKEVINNAAKHSAAKNVFVCISQKEHHIEMIIKDDGNGFNTATEFNGNGMSSLKKRAAELNAQFNITSQINIGTIVQLTFKTSKTY